MTRIVRAVFSLIWLCAVLSCGRHEEPAPAPAPSPPPAPAVQGPLPLAPDTEQAARARIAEARGKVQVRGWAAESFVAAKPGMPLEQGDLVEVGGEDGYAEVAFDDGSRMRLFPNTKVKIALSVSVDVKRKVLLLVGRLWLKVGELVGGSSFSVKTANAVAGVRGTAFRVSMAGDGALLVRVEEGKVEVSTRSKKVEVSQNQEVAAFSDTTLDGPASMSTTPDEKWLQERSENLVANADKLAALWSVRIQKDVKATEELRNSVSKSKDALKGAVAAARAGSGSKQQVADETGRFLQEADTLADEVEQLEGVLYLLESLDSVVKTNEKAFGPAAGKFKKAFEQSEPSRNRLKEQSGNTAALFREEIPEILKEARSVAPEGQFKAPPAPLPEKGETVPPQKRETPTQKTEKAPTEQPSGQEAAGGETAGAGGRAIDLAAKDFLAQPQPDEKLALATIKKVCPLPESRTRWESWEALNRECEKLIAGMNKVIALNAEIVPRQIKGEELGKRLEVLKKMAADIGRLQQELRTGRALLDSPDKVKKSFEAEGEMSSFSIRLRGEISRYEQQVREFRK